MNKKRFLSGIISGVMVLSTLTIPAFAATTFSDVENDSTVSWAKSYISQMAELEYIKGYEDGTFKPSKSISKIESLIIISRMLGVDEPQYADSVDSALTQYESDLSKYSTNYNKEIAFLLYNGVLSENDLTTYVSSSTKDTELKRYEAAILITKLLGAQQAVEESAFVSSSYSDTLQIPDDARAYVEYVKDQGIMTGMGNSADGQPIFSPLTAVTRAQMAKMLASLIEVLDRTTQTGTIVSIDKFNDTFTATTNGLDVVNEIDESTVFRKDGELSTFEELYPGESVKITHRNGVLSLVEHFTVLEDSVIYGVVTSTKEESGVQTIIISDANDSSKRNTFTLANKATVKISGAIDSFGKVKNTNYVRLTISDGVVALLEVIDKSSTDVGILTDISYDNDVTNISVRNKANNDITDYEVLSDISVSRNGLDSSLSELMNGDTLTLKLTYGKISKIAAVSEMQTYTGTISSIYISASKSQLTITSNGNEYTFDVNKSANFTLDSSAATIYDLRPLSTIKVNVESNEITKVESASIASKTQVAGIVKSVNTTYGLMVLDVDGTEFSVFVKDGSTKIIDSATGNSLKIKGIAVGKSVSVTGSNSTGVFEASVVVVQ